MKAWLSLTIGCLVAALAVGSTHFVTAPTIASNKQAFADAALLSVVPGAKELERLQQDVYRAWQSDTTSAYIFRFETPQAYNAPIEFWIAVTEDRRVAGLRVISHRETPGIGDFVDANISAWNDQFLRADLSAQWQLSQSGGDFDHRSGATITSRAMVQGIGNALQSANKNLPSWQVIDGSEP